MMRFSIIVTKKVANWLIVGYIFALLLLSIVSFNGHYSPSSKQMGRIRADYILHTIFFLPWMVLASIKWNPSNRSKLFWTILWIGFAFAAISELVQLLVPNKTFNPIDLVANGLGVLFGSMIFLLLPSQGCSQK